MTLSSRSLLLFALVVALGPCPGWARGDLISISGQGSLASFTGSLSYSPSSANNAVLTILLENTSPVAGGGYLTAFAFNNPDDRITAATFSGPANFALLGGPGFNNSVNGAPFGRFDLGASTGGGLNGGGAPNKGLGVGTLGTFIFTLTGTGLDLLTAGDFLATTSVPPGAGQGVEAFLVRFRGMADGDDRVAYAPPAPTEPSPGLQESVPEPGSLCLAATALLALAGWRRQRRARPGA
jgi:hypothetical protein